MCQTYWRVSASHSSWQELKKQLKHRDIKDKRWEEKEEERADKVTEMDQHRLCVALRESLVSSRAATSWIYTDVDFKMMCQRLPGKNVQTPRTERHMKASCKMKALTSRMEQNRGCETQISLCGENYSATAACVFISPGPVGIFKKARNKSMANFFCFCRGQVFLPYLEYCVFVEAIITVCTDATR